MANLWIKDLNDDKWSVLSLSSTTYNLKTDPLSSALIIHDKLNSKDGIVLVPTVSDTEFDMKTSTSVANIASWSLLSSDTARILINGLPIATGFRVLKHKDEILIDDKPPIFFSSERLARVEKLLSTNRKLICPRDKREIKVGEYVVVCPNCGVVHHETEDYNCWTYGEKCAVCDRKTNLTNEFSWVPDDC